MHFANGVLLPRAGKAVLTMDGPDPADVAALSCVLCTRQLAGMMLAIAVAQVATENLPEESWTLRQQADDALFRKVMPLVFALNALTISVAFAKAGKQQRCYVGAAGLFFLVLRFLCPRHVQLEP